MLFITLADNITYASGGGTVNGRPSATLEASLYEVPVNTKPSVNTTAFTATYADPDVYFEYATLGPNEQLVIKNN